MKFFLSLAISNNSEILIIILWYVFVASIECFFYDVLLLHTLACIRLTSNVIETASYAESRNIY